MSFKIDLVGISSNALNQVNRELKSRSSIASMELRNAAMEVLRGKRSGRVYHKPGGGKYTASAPGEPPAVRLGVFRKSWRPVQYGANHQNPAIETNEPYAGYLEDGTPGGMIAPRPFADKIVEKAKPEVEAIYAQPFDINL